MSFLSHGTFTVEISEQLLIVDAKGPFNEEIVHEYKQAVSKAIDQFNEQPWQQIIIMRAESIFIPDAYEEMRKLAKYRKSRGLTASAVIWKESTAKEIVSMQLGNIYKEADVACAFFENKTQALSWLNNI